MKKLLCGAVGLCCVIVLSGCGQPANPTTSALSVSDGEVQVVIDRYGIPYLSESEPSADPYQAYAKLSCALSQVKSIYFPLATPLFLLLGQGDLPSQVNLGLLNQYLARLPGQYRLLVNPYLSINDDGSLAAAPNQLKFEDLLAFRRWNQTEPDVRRILDEMDDRVKEILGQYVAGLRKHYTDFADYYRGRFPEQDQFGLFAFARGLTVEQFIAARVSTYLLYGTSYLTTAVGHVANLQQQSPVSQFGQHADEYPGASNVMAIGGQIATGEMGYSAPHVPSLPWNSLRFTNRLAVFAMPQFESSLAGFFLEGPSVVVGGTGNAFWGLTANPFFDGEMFFVEIEGDHYVDYIDGGLKPIVVRSFTVPTANGSRVQVARETRFGRIVGEFDNVFDPTYSERIALVVRLPSHPLQQDAQHIAQSISALTDDYDQFAAAFGTEYPYWHEVRYFDGKGVDTRSHMGRRPKLGNTAHSNLGAVFPSPATEVTGIHTAGELPHATGQAWAIAHNSPPDQNCADCGKLSSAWPRYTAPNAGSTTYRTQQSRRFVDTYERQGETIDFEAFANHATSTVAEKFYQLARLLQMIGDDIDGWREKGLTLNEAQIKRATEMISKLRNWDGSIKRDRAEGLYLNLLWQILPGYSGFSAGIEGYIRLSEAHEAETIYARVTSGDVSLLLLATAALEQKYQDDCVASGVRTWGQAYQIYFQGVAVSSPVGAPDGQRSIGADLIPGETCRWHVTDSSPMYALWQAQGDDGEPHGWVNAFGGIMSEHSPFFAQTAPRWLALGEAEGMDAFVELKLKGRLPAAEDALWTGSLTCE